MRRLCCLCLLLAATLTPLGARAQDDQLREQIALVLKAHPELILEVLREHRAEFYDLLQDEQKVRRDQVFEQKVRQALADPAQPALDPSRPFAGPADAPGVVVVYTNFMCPACAEGEKDLERFQKLHPDLARTFIKHLPADETGQQLALYFEAIGQQDRELAWQFLRQVFADQERIKKEGLAPAEALVAGMKLDQDRLRRDMGSPELAARLVADRAEAEKLDVRSTPTLVVQGVILDGAAPPDVITRILELSRSLTKQ